jgi:maltose alpha-D-glucosyltransferase/alpha-amylase
MRRMLGVRRMFPVFGTGSIQVVRSANPSVLAFVRADRRASESGRETSNPVLCVHNLSRSAQPADLDVGEWAGRQPVELLGRVAFPLIGSDPYPVTLGPYGSLSFELV